jgi:hypothetical protein
MDPITLIVGALAAGAALGISDTASSAIKDAYAGLKALVRKRLGGRPDAELVLAKHEQAPETWRAPLMAELDEAGTGHDADLVAAAEALMRLVMRPERGRGSTRSMCGAHKVCRSATATLSATCSAPHRA